MALPGSGNLGIKLIAGSSRSIELEVEGNTSGTITISSLRTQSGFSSPVRISDWYGYSASSIPNAPTKINSSNGAFWIECIWFCSCDNEDGFDIEWSINGGGWGNAGTTGPNVTTKIFPGTCFEGSTYAARVRSFNGAGDSAWNTETTPVTAGGQCIS